MTNSSCNSVPHSHPSHLKLLRQSWEQKSRGETVPLRNVPSECREEKLTNTFQFKNNRIWHDSKGENRTRLRWPRNSRQQLEKNCFESPVVFHPISVMVGTSHILSKPVFALPVKSRAYRKHFPHSIVVGGAWEIKVKCFVQCPLKWKAELLFVVFNLPRRKPQGRIRCTQD